MNVFYSPTKIVYGHGSIDSLPEYAKAGDKFLIVTDKILMGNGVVKLITDVLDSGSIPYAVYDEVTPSPLKEQVDAGVAKAKAEGCNAVIGLGGGSPIDVSKMVAFMMTNPGTVEQYQFEFRPTEAKAAKLITVPTTSGSGSEAGNCSVIVTNGVKCGIARDDLFPLVAIVDPKAMATMPPSVTSTTGMDAFIHAYECYVGLGATSITDGWAWESMQMIIDNLHNAYKDGSDLEARSQMALAACMAGIVKDIGGLGMIHACSDGMCGTYHVPHGLANSVILPLGMKYNMDTNLPKHAKLAELFGIDTRDMTQKEAAEAALEAVVQYMREMDIPDNVEKWFEKEEDLDQFVENATNAYVMLNNIKKPGREELKDLYLTIFKRK